MYTEPKYKCWKVNHVKIVFPCLYDNNYYDNNYYEYTCNFAQENHKNHKSKKHLLIMQLMLTTCECNKNFL